MNEEKKNKLCREAIESCGRAAETLGELTPTGREALATTRQAYGDSVMFFEAVAHFWKAFDANDERFRLEKVEEVSNEQE